jgi:heat shock protein HslJ
MDMEGNPIRSDLPYELTSDGIFLPTELEAMFLHGMMTYMAESASFEECVTGRRYPIATEGDYLALERGYLDARAEPGAPVLVQVEGGLATRPAMEGPDRTHLVVERFIKTAPGEICAGRDAVASLTNTYWRLDRLSDAPVAAVENRREPHLVLLDAPDARFRATVGCNQIMGGYQRDGDSMSFGGVAMTRMACPPPLDARERHLLDALQATRAFRLVGPTLILLDARGSDLAEFSAVYLR